MILTSERVCLEIEPIFIYRLSKKFDAIVITDKDIIEITPDGSSNARPRDMSKLIRTDHPTFRNKLFVEKGTLYFGIGRRDQVRLKEPISRIRLDIYTPMGGEFLLLGFDKLYAYFATLNVPAMLRDVKREDIKRRISIDRVEISFKERIDDAYAYYKEGFIHLYTLSNGKVTYYMIPKSKAHIKRREIFFEGLSRRAKMVRSLEEAIVGIRE